MSSKSNPFLEDQSIPWMKIDVDCKKTKCCKKYKKKGQACKKCPKFG